MCGDVFSININAWEEGYRHLTVPKPKMPTNLQSKERVSIVPVTVNFLC